MLVLASLFLRLARFFKADVGIKLTSRFHHIGEYVIEVTVLNGLEHIFSSLSVPR